MFIHNVSQATHKAIKVPSFIIFVYNNINPTNRWFLTLLDFQINEMSCEASGFQQEKKVYAKVRQKYYAFVEKNATTLK